MFLEYSYVKLVCAMKSIISKAKHPLIFNLKKSDPPKAVASKRQAKSVALKSSFIEIKLYFYHAPLVCKKIQNQKAKG
jgi:hypothetical protein